MPPKGGRATGQTPPARGPQRWSAPSFPLLPGAKPGQRQNRTRTNRRPLRSRAAGSTHHRLRPGPFWAQE
eukprot:8238361-Pyramimonas_sp.AAC.1